MKDSGTFGENLRVYRKAARISQKDLAMCVGLSANYMSLLEHGRRSPSPATLLCLCKVLGVLPADLREVKP